MFRKHFHQAAIGVDISDYSIEVLSLKKTFRRPKVLAYNRIILEEGIISNGKILKPKLLSENIKHAVRGAKPKPIHGRLCLVSLPESQVLGSTFTLPATLKGSDLRRVILGEVQKNLPIAINSTYYDFSVAEQSPREMSVFFAAAKKSLIHSYLEVFQMADLYPLAFDVESANIHRSLRVGSGRKPVVVIDLGARTTSMFLFQNGILQASHTLTMAGMDLTKSVAKNLRVDFQKAEKIKKQIGLHPNKLGGGVFSALIPQLHEIASGIRKFLLHHHALKIRKVYLVGGTALLFGILDYLRDALSHPVSLGNPLASINTRHWQFNKRRAVLYANVIGLALRGIAQDPYSTGINLLSQARYRK